MGPKKKRHLNVYAFVLYVILILFIANACVSIKIAKKLNQAVVLAGQATTIAQTAQDIAAEAVKQCEQYKAALQELEQTKAPEQPEERKTLWVEATAYCPCPKCCGIWSEQHPSRIGTDYEQLTASGTKPQANHTIATDPSVIPTGSRVLINGHEYVAEDVGGGVNGNHIDIFFNTHEEAVSFGRQNLEVTIIEN